MHLVKMTMKWPSSMIGRGPKMFRYKIHWKLTYKYSDGSGYYHGADGSDGYIYSDGSGYYHGADGSDGYNVNFQ